MAFGFNPVTAARAATQAFPDQFQQSDNINVRGVSIPRSALGPAPAPSIGVPIGGAFGGGIANIPLPQQSGVGGAQAPQQGQLQVPSNNLPVTNQFNMQPQLGGPSQFGGPPLPGSLSGQQGGIDPANLMQLLQSDPQLMQLIMSRMSGIGGSF